MQTNKQAVYWAYFLFLGRIPESDSTTCNWLSQTLDARALVQSLTASLEFKHSMRYERIFTPDTYLSEATLSWQNDGTRAGDMATAWAIRLLLNREPSDLDLVHQWSRYTYAEMLRAIVCTDEYQAQRHHDDIFKNAQLNLKPIYKTIALSELPTGCLADSAQNVSGHIYYDENHKDLLQQIRIHSHNGAVIKNINIHLNSIPHDLQIYAYASNQNIKIGSNCQGGWAFRLLGEGGNIEVGNDVKAHLNDFKLDGNALVKIGNDCCFEGVTYFHVGDGHAVFDLQSLAVLNYNGQPSIVIRNHVKFAPECTILSGTTVESGCLVEARALLKGTYPANSLLIGLPAKVLRDGITWTYGHAPNRINDVLQYLNC